MWFGDVNLEFCHPKWLFPVVVLVSAGILGKKGTNPGGYVPDKAREFFPFCTVSCSFHGHKVSRLQELGEQVSLPSLERIRRMELLASSRLTHFPRGKTCAWWGGARGPTEVKVEGMICLA